MKKQYEEPVYKELCTFQRYEITVIFWALEIRDAPDASIIFAASIVQLDSRPDSCRKLCWSTVPQCSHLQTKIVYGIFY